MPIYVGSEVASPSWKLIGVAMLRAMLNDIGATNYTTERLESILVTAAYFLPIEIHFYTAYTVDVIEETLTPEPLEQRDGDDFIALAVLKAACIIDESSFRTAALLQGVTARCGPAILNTGSHGQYLKELLVEGPCKAYETMKYEYNFGYSGAKVLRAIMSPFVSNEFSTFNQDRTHRH